MKRKLEKPFPIVGLELAPEADADVDILAVEDTERQGWKAERIRKTWNA